MQVGQKELVLREKEKQSGTQQKSGNREPMAPQTELESGLLVPDCFLNLDPRTSQGWVACNFFWVLEVLCSLFKLRWVVDVSTAKQSENVAVSTWYKAALYPVFKSTVC